MHGRLGSRRREVTAFFKDAELNSLVITDQVSALIIPTQDKMNFISKTPHTEFVSRAFLLLFLLFRIT